MPDPSRLSEAQCLAIVTALAESKTAKRALEVALGHDRLPDLKEFHTTDADEVEKWKEFLYLLETAAEVLRGSFTGRDVQSTFEPAATG